ncbi:hypothetical protein ACIQF6_28790 [Kitasatospora sp. NPDC092948]
MTNLLARTDSGRIIHLDGHRPLSHGPHSPVKKFTGRGRPRPAGT